MPHGVTTTYRPDGRVEVDFADRAAANLALRRVRALAGPGAARPDTGGTRRTWVMDEHAARAAGLVDDPPTVQEEPPQPQPAPTGIQAAEAPARPRRAPRGRKAAGDANADS